MSLWSAPFGLALLEAVELRRGLTVLDVGCGAGFPLLELLSRLGPSARGVGVDPDGVGLRRARGKAAASGLARLTLLRAIAELLPLADATVDLVVSNNGFNNVQDLGRALREARRVCRAGAQLVFTQNLSGTLRPFYDQFAAALRDLGLFASVEAMEAHIAEKRPSVASVKEKLGAAGFLLEGETEGRFSLRFLDGAAFFAHPLIRDGFLPPWRAVPPPDRVPEVFTRLTAALDRMAAASGGLHLEVPFVCLQARARS